LPTIVLGRREAGLSWRLLVPVALTFAAWSAWALDVTDTEVWAAALTLPFTRNLSLSMPLVVLLAGWPWAPLAGLVACRSIRDSWTVPQRDWAMGWLQVAGVALVVGILLPGMAVSAKVVAVVGLALVAAAVVDRVLAGKSSPSATRLFIVVAFAVVMLWMVVAIPLGGYLAAAISFYRQLAFVLVVLSFGTGLVALAALGKRKPAWAFGAVVAVACLTKLVHAGIYVPERNYRLSQGPWGRAIGQWVPPNWPIYTFHAWPTDLAFFTDRPVRQLPDPKLLQFKSKDRPHYVLLLPPEFDHWPADAPKVKKIRSFVDERGDERILARTEGEVFIRKL
jgi:hypothetical protein